MHRFLSEAWIQDYRSKWNGNAGLKQNLKGFNASIKYFIEGRDAEAQHLIVSDGIVTDSGPADRSSYDFELWAKPKHWKQLAEGDMGQRAAMITKRLKFKGSMVTAMRYMTAFEASLKMMAEVPSNLDELR